LYICITKQKQHGKEQNIRAYDRIR
jgi:hypothetical protein